MLFVYGNENGSHYGTDGDNRPETSKKSSVVPRPVFFPYGMLVVFGPYRRTIPFSALGNKADDNEGGNEDNREAGSEFEEVEEVLHGGVSGPSE